MEIEASIDFQNQFDPDRNHANKSAIETVNGRNQGYCPAAIQSARGMNMAIQRNARAGGKGGGKLVELEAAEVCAEGQIRIQRQLAARKQFNQQVGILIKRALEIDCVLDGKFRRRSRRCRRAFEAERDGGISRAAQLREIRRGKAAKLEHLDRKSTRLNSS